ncbi:MAG: sugar phosphate isomerase/epimerase family protein [Promethearchaeati archaeon SRVP18_Atabeyarchaeia-1]
MRFGATIYTLSAKGKFKEFVQELYDLKFRIFELYLPFYNVISPDSSINEKPVKELKDALSTFEIEELSAHGYYDDEVGVISNIASVDETTRKMAERTLLSTIDLCAKLNVRVLNEHPGTIFPELKRSGRINISFMANDFEKLGKAKATEMAERTLRDCAKVAEDNDIMICVENEVPRLDTLPIADNPIVIPTLVENLDNDHIRATCDVGHLALSASFFGFDMIFAVKMLKPYLRHLHLHDNKLVPFPVGGTDKQKGFGDLHLPPGQGLIDFDDVMKALTGVDAVYNLEVLEYKTLSDFRVAADFLAKKENG